MAKNFDKEKESSSDASKLTNLANEGMAVASDFPESPATRNAWPAEWIFIPDERFETIRIVDTSDDVLM